MSQTTKKYSVEQASIPELLDHATACIETGEDRLRAAAADIAKASEMGATQREIAEAVGKSAAWVNGLLQWHHAGYPETCFGPQSKAKRDRAAAVRSPEQEVAAEVDDEQDDGAAAPDPRTQHFAKLSGPAMEATYTSLIKSRALYEGACELPWSQYFAYRDQHAECAPLSSDDLRYVGMWTNAGPAVPTVIAATDEVTEVAPPIVDTPTDSFDVVGFITRGSITDDEIEAEADEAPAGSAHLQAMLETPQDDPFWSAFADHVGPEKLHGFIAKLQAVYAANYNDALDKAANIFVTDSINAIVENSKKVRKAKKADTPKSPDTEAPVEESAEAIAAAASAAKAWL